MARRRSEVGRSIRSERFLRPRHALAVVVALAVLAAALTAEPPDAEAQSPSDIAYVYDELGRLIAVVDPSQGAAIYNYDAVGNLTSIVRQSASITSILEFTPNDGPIGTKVTLYGTGFSSTPSENQVRFNGAPAAVVSASATEIVVTVPSGATSGAISLTTPTGTATSSDSFVVAAAGPSISGLSPLIAAPGDSVTISGTGFDPAFANNRVKLNINQAAVTSAGTSSVVFTVPPLTGSGPVTLFTPLGTASGGDLFVPPSPYVPGDVGSTGRAVFGTPKTVTTSSADQVGLLVFDGTAGQRVSLIVTSSSYPQCEFISIKDPAGVTIAGPICMGTNGFMDVVSLPSTGTYTILVDPRFADTGSLTIRLYDVPPDPTGPITIGGSATVTTTAPGQNATLTFSATAGQTVSLAITGSSYPQCEFISIKNPTGGTIAGPSCGGQLNDVSLATAGTYTIVIDPRFADTGSMTLALSDASAGAAAPQSLEQEAAPQTTPEGEPSSQPNPSPTPSPSPTPTPSPAPSPSPSGTPSPTPSSTASSAGTVSTQAASIQALSTQSGSVDDEESLRTGPGGPEFWAPDPEHLNNWYSGRPNTALTQLQPLVADPGVTAVSGQVLTLNGSPLKDVTLEIAGRSTTTDGTGRFLVTDVEAGRHELMIDGRSASTPVKSYGIFCWGMEVVTGRTNILPFTVWMPLLDTDNVIRIPSPTTSEVVVTTPYIPGLEVRIPPGTVITGEDGEVVTEVGITPIPIDRTPFPLPAGVEVPIYFTIQPGGAYLSKKARIIYPNYMGRSPGTRIDFWHYDPEDEGWYVYGRGSVTSDGEQVVPDRYVGIYEFSGAMINSGRVPPDIGPKDGSEDGDPVNLGTGLFVHQKTDLVLPDVLPVSMTRTYRQGDPNARAFGPGMTHDFEIFLWSAQQYTEADLILPDGGRVHYVRSDGCNPCGFLGAKFESVGRPGPFYKSRLEWNGSGWDLTRKDGLVYVFGDTAPLQSIRDRYGNTITITREGGPNGNITQIRSPNGRWLQISYVSGTGRISQVTDNIGRTVSYQYDEQARLWKVTDANGEVTEYGYEETSERLRTIKDPRQISFLTNEYDANGRVFKQMQADGTFYQFTYTLDGSGNVTRTDITDPRGIVRQVSFASGFTTSDKRAVGRPEEQLIMYERESGTNLVASTTDALGRKTEYGYDPFGNVASVTRLADTSDAVTTTFEYEQPFNQLKRVTDPLSHVTRFEYDAKGNLKKIIDPLQHETLMTYNSAGQNTSITDALGNKSEFGYELGDLYSVKDPLGNVAIRFVDAAGRVASQTDPAGARTLYQYDKLNQLLKTTDALGGLTQFTYDENGNLLTVKDARNNVTGFTPNSMDWTASREDALNHSESFVYDGLGNLTSHTDRKGQVTTFAYDGLNRLVSQVSQSASYDLGAGPDGDLVVDGAQNPRSNPYRLTDGQSYSSVVLINGGWIAPSGGDPSLEIRVSELISICSTCGIDLAGYGGAGGLGAPAGATGTPTAGGGPGPGQPGANATVNGGGGGGGGHAAGGSPGSGGGAGNGAGGAGGGSYGTADLAGNQLIGSGGGGGGRGTARAGGKGGAGGGFVHIVARNIDVQGQIVADGLWGENGLATAGVGGGGGGGGSAGSVWLTAQQVVLATPNAITTSGGGGGGGAVNGGAGAKGRVRIDTDSLTGAGAGGNASWGSFEQRSFTSPDGVLVVGAPYSQANPYRLAHGKSYSSVTLESGAWLAPAPGNSSLWMRVAGTVSICSICGIDVSGVGGGGGTGAPSNGAATGGSGWGAGGQGGNATVNGGGGGGGGHAGAGTSGAGGGTGNGTAGWGGSAYGAQDLSDASTKGAGSGGGGGGRSLNQAGGNGGAGAGYLQLVAGSIDLEGRILANGRNGLPGTTVAGAGGGGGGGGSGGSVWLIAASINLAQANAISTAGGSGGAGGRVGGAGAHGRVRIDADSLTGLGAAGNSTWGSFYRAGLKATTYSYDAGDRLRTATSAAGVYTRNYDDLDHLTSEASPQGQISYTFDDADRRATMTVAGQPQTVYVYDDADRLQSITRGSQQVGYDYDDANRLTQLSLPGGITQTYGYNLGSQLTGITYKSGALTIGELTYGYDAAGRRSSQGGSFARTGLPDAVASFTHNANNQMITRAGTTLTYDLNGNLTSDGTYTYGWDALDRLSQVKQGSSTIARYVYDPFKRRQKRSAAATTTEFLYDRLNAIQEKTGGLPSANLVSGLRIDQHHTRTDSAGHRNLLTDALGSTVALTDISGGVQTTYTFEPFGRTATSGSANGNTFQFTGREADSGALIYYRARYYSPGMQRFISEDPIGFSGGDENLYAYVGGSPTNLTDPTGELIPLLIGIGAFLGGTGYVAWHKISGRKATWKGFILSTGAGAGTAVGGYYLGSFLGLFGGPGLQFAGQRLQEHWQKHAGEFAEFGYKTAAQYQAGAQQLIARANRVLTHVRANGDRLIYDARTNEFTVVSPEGVIRTYLRPEAGMEYWLRQVGE